MVKLEAVKRMLSCWWLVALVGLGACGSSFGDAAPGQRMVDYVPPSFLQSETPSSAAGQPLLAPIPRLRNLHKPGWGERWEKFESEFGIQQKSANPVVGALETAKYDLDRTSLSLAEFVSTVEERLRFDYPLRNIGSDGSTPRHDHRVYGNPFADAWENAHFGTDINLNEAGHTFVGLKLVLPIGD